MPPAGGKKAWLGCPPAVASCGRHLHPPELLHSCRADRSAAADRCAAAFPAPPQRTLDIDLAQHCPERHGWFEFFLLFYIFKYIELKEREENNKSAFETQEMTANLVVSSFYTVSIDIDIYDI